MKYRIARIADTEEMRAIHKMAFGGDRWPGDDHEFWVMYDAGGAVVAFASAVLLATEVAYLSRCAVVLKHRGKGIQKRMIRERMKWAKKEGARLVVTHVHRNNFASLMSLLGEGFRFITNNRRDYRDFLMLFKGTATEGELGAWCDAMLEN